MKKVILGVVLGLLVIVGAGAYFLFLNLDFIIKNNIEKYASLATQSKVTLDSVKLELTTGQGSLSGLKVENPKGFSTPQALYLGKIDVQVDSSTIRGTGPIVIKQVLIEKPQVTYELLNDGNSNLQAIQKNAEAYANSFQKGAGTSAQPAPAATPTTPTAPEQPARKIIIEDLTISSGQVAVSQQMLGGQQLNVPLPVIHLTNIGKESGGATAAEVAHQVLSSVISAASQASLTELAKQKISGLLKAVPASSIGNAAVDTIGNQVKGIFGK